MYITIQKKKKRDCFRAHSSHLRSVTLFLFPFLSRFVYLAVHFEHYTHRIAVVQFAERIFKHSSHIQLIYSLQQSLLNQTVVYATRTSNNVSANEWSEVWWNTCWSRNHQMKRQRWKLETCIALHLIFSRRTHVRISYGMWVKWNMSVDDGSCNECVCNKRK